jgi:methylthioxylose transferase
MTSSVLDRDVRPAGSEREPASRRDRAIIAALGLGAGLIAATHAWGRWLQARGHRMAVNAPPLTGNIDPRASAWSLAAVAVAAGIVGGADRLSRTLDWRRLLCVSFAAALGWSITLALWDGTAGLVRSPAAPVDYLAALPRIGDVGAFIRTLVDSPRSFPTHVQVHPPGFVLLLLGLRGVALATPGWVAVVEHVVGASSVPAVMIAARAVAGERAARAAAPFLVGAPIAIAWSSGDAVFLGVGAWATTLTVLAIVRRGARSDVLALAAGPVWAVGIFLSYGLVLLSLVPAAVAFDRRSMRPLVLAALPVVASAAIVAAGGFWWFDGLAATRGAYAQSLARLRPYPYFIVANVAAVTIAVGPAVWVGLSRLRDRRLWAIVAGALAAIAIADISGMSKGEVERIWLPFLPWVVLAAASLEGTSVLGRRTWLATQVTWALVVQWLVLAPW